MSKPQLRAFVAFLTLIAPSASCFAEGLDHRLFGAWTPSASDCAKIFEVQAGHLAFRAPIDQFLSALIIGPQEIMAPGGRCRIGKTSNVANVTTMELDCHNAIGYSSQTSQVTILSDTEFKYDPTGTGDPALNVTYEKCPF